MSVCVQCVASLGILLSGTVTMLLLFLRQDFAEQRKAGGTQLYNSGSHNAAAIFVLDDREVLNRTQATELIRTLGLFHCVVVLLGCLPDYSAAALNLKLTPSFAKRNNTNIVPNKKLKPAQ